MKNFSIIKNFYLFRTISIGIPGLTMATFINSDPKSIDITDMLSS